MSKTKNKKPGKSGRLDSRNPDLSELRKPIKISVSSLKEAAKLLETGTLEIRDLLTYEVNLLYECRICRSIFRSLVNFLSHKRVFCREKFNASSENKSRDDNANSVNYTTEDLQSLELDQITLDNLVNPSKNDRILRSQAPNKANKKDLTSVVDMLQKKQVEKFIESPSLSENMTERTDCDQVVLQILDSKRAAYQTLIEPNLSSNDLMENQVIELDNIMNQDSVVLGADGQIEKSDSPVHFYNNEESSKLVCDFCSSTFMTQKTLNAHIKIKHAPVRDSYACPCNSCTASFSNYSNAKRHLTSVHRKIGQELETLSQKIEKRTIRNKTITIVNKKTKKPEIVENSLLNSMETQEWVERLRPPEQFECVSCEIQFQEKLSLLNHLKNCPGPNESRIDEIFENEPEVEENSERNSSKETVQDISSDDPQQSPTEETSEISFEKEASNGLEISGVSTLSEEVWSKLPTSCDRITDFELFQKMLLNLKKPIANSNSETQISECPSFTFKPVDSSRKRKFSVNEITEGVQGEKAKKTPPQENRTDNLESRKSSSQLISETIASIADHTKLECIACRRSFSNIMSLNRHMENHIKINRYRCNKCSFKSVNRNDCVGHCNKMHNAMNNRQVLNEMISQIPHDELTLSQEMITVEPSNLTNIDSRRPNINYQFANSSPTSNPFPNHQTNADRVIPDEVNLYASEPEPEEIIIAPIENLPANVSTPKTNRITDLQSSETAKIDGYSPALCDLNSSLNFPDDENEISREFCNIRSNSRNSKRSYSRNSTRSRASNRSSSRDSIASEVRRTTRSSSRLSKKLQSDDDDENFELFSSDDERKSKSKKRRSSSQASRRSTSTIITRSRSRLGNKIPQEGQEGQENENNRSTDFGSESKRSKSKSRKEETVKRGRGRPRERRSAPVKMNSDFGKQVQRRESFSSESSQTNRPIRNRVKHVEKDFIYDLEDDAFGKSAKKIDNRLDGSAINSNGMREIFDDSDDDLMFLEELSRANSNSELDDSELFFKGFPRETKILNNDC